MTSRGATEYPRPGEAASIRATRAVFDVGVQLGLTPA